MKIQNLMYCLMLTIVLMVPLRAEPDTASKNSDTSEKVPPVNVAPPQWFTDIVKANTHGSGRWVTNNGDYQSDQEPWDKYLLQWQAGPNNGSMTGRMWAEVNGKPSKGDFWQFSQYWDPARQVAVIQQSGWGAMGIGEISAPNEQGEISMRQVFTGFDGNAVTQGHKVKWVDESTHDTWSLSWDDQGNEVPGRFYRWALER